MSSNPEIALIVGASQGIGLALVENILSGKDSKFLPNNTLIVATARDAKSPQLVKLQEQYKDRLVIEVVDVLDDASVDAFISKVNSTYPRLDFFVYNSGIVNDQQTRKFHALDKQKYFEAHTVNAIAPNHIFHGLLPLLNKTHELKGGKVGDKITKFEEIKDDDFNVTYNRDDETKVRCAFVSSMMGSMNMHTFKAAPIYRTSKAALNHVVKDMAVSFPYMGLFLLHPGYTRTSLTGGNGDITPDVSAAGMLAALSREGYASNSCQSLISYDGSHMPW